MIIWIMGQPNSGKSTLSLHVEALLGSNCVAVIDGDDIRKGTNNLDYTVEGRKKNIYLIQDLAAQFDLPDPKKAVIVAAVSPYRDMREDFKKKNFVKEIYLFSERTNNNQVKEFEPPLKNALFLNTSRYGIELCAKRILNFCGLSSEEPS
jgi:adenylylsulfate kinase-like enzyme